MFLNTGGRRLKAGTPKAVPDPTGMHKSWCSIGGVAVTSSHQLRLGRGHCLHLSVPHLEVEALALGFLGGQEALWEEGVAVGVGIGDQGAAVIGLGPPSQGGRLCIY